MQANDFDICEALDELTNIRRQQASIMSVYAQSDMIQSLEYQAAEIQGNIVQAFVDMRKQIK